MVTVHGVLEAGYNGNSANPSYQIAPPSEMDFSKPEEWAKWIRRFERFRQASGLSTKAETDQVNTLVYSMGDEADDILQSLSLNDEDSATFNGVKAKFDAYFIGSRNVIYERAKFNQRKQMTGEPEAASYKVWSNSATEREVRDLPRVSVLTRARIRKTSHTPN